MYTYKSKLQSLELSLKFTSMCKVYFYVYHSGIDWVTFQLVHLADEDIKRYVETEFHEELYLDEIYNARIDVRVAQSEKFNSPRCLHICILL